MGFADDRYEAEYAKDCRRFACVDMVRDELSKAAENGVDFGRQSDEAVAQDLHRYSPVAELWPYDEVLVAVSVARRPMTQT